MRSPGQIPSAWPSCLIIGILKSKSLSRTTYLSAQGAKGLSGVTMPCKPLTSRPDKYTKLQSTAKDEIPKKLSRHKLAMNKVANKHK